MPEGALPWILVAVLAVVAGWLLLNRAPKTEKPAAPVNMAPAPRTPDPEPEPEEAEHEDTFFYELGFGIGYYRSSRRVNNALAAAAEALLPNGHTRRLLDDARMIWDEKFGGEIVPDRLCRERILPEAKDWPDARKDALVTGGMLMLMMDDPEAGKGYVDPNAHENLRLEMTAVLESFADALYGAERDARMASVRARAAELAPSVFAKAGL